MTAPVAGVDVGGVRLGGGAPLALIAGPCAIENAGHALRTAERLGRRGGGGAVPGGVKCA